MSFFLPTGKPATVSKIITSKFLVMKTLHFVFSFVFVLAAAFAASAQKASFVSNVKKENIKVWGECGMCKHKIEKAALSAGVETASWNEDSKVLAVAYKAGKTSSLKIEEAVAAAGYDTKSVTASSEAYNSLPECCHYQRKEPAAQVQANCCSNSTATMNCCKDAACCKDGKCDSGSCKDMAACKDKACCASTATSSCCKDAACCKDGKCNSSSCKDMAACKDKACCKS